MRLKDKVVIVTAATRGIGLGIVKKCAEEGARIYIGARNLEKGEEVAKSLCDRGYSVRCVYNDAKVPDSYQSMAKEIADREGKIDVLVNNFGTSDPKIDLDIENTDTEVFLDTVTVNLRSVFMASKEVLKYMRKHGGSIINISSVGGVIPDVSQIAYGTSKASINYLTRLIAVHEAKNGVRANAVLPGMIGTDSVMGNLSDDFKEFFKRHIPLGRIGLVDEIASAVVYFASDESQYTTGEILTVSGGFGLATPIYADFRNKAHKR
jgi:NAD(P)-dependent dehydrogenase (short-subunit alcohol dehydrogenase family)